MTGWRARLDGLLAGATPGPWYAGEGVAAQDVNVWDQDGVPTRAVAQDIFDDADRALIAASRELVPLLVNVAKAAEAESAEQYECILCTRSWPDGEPDHFDGCPLAALRAWGNDA